MSLKKLKMLFWQAQVFTNLEWDLDLLYDRALGERDLDLDADLSFLPFLSWGDFYKKSTTSLGSSGLLLYC